MRLNILAFAAGVLWLQMQPELPVWWHWALGGSVLFLPRLHWSAWPTKLLTIVACCALGFAWASWRADLRLTDELARDWEGQDVEVVGVVATLPQDFSNGSRFEFALETALTVAAVVPQRVMLSWYQGRGDGDSLGCP